MSMSILLLHYYSISIAVPGIVIPGYRHHEEAERENYRRNGPRPRGRATFAAHSNNCI